MDVPSNYFRTRLDDGWESFYSRNLVAANSAADAKYEFGRFNQTARVNEDAAFVEGVGLLLYLHHGPLSR